MTMKTGASRLLVPVAHERDEGLQDRVLGRICFLLNSWLLCCISFMYCLAALLLLEFVIMCFRVLGSVYTNLQI